MKKVLIGLIVGSGIVLAQPGWNITATPFASFWNYDKGVRTSGVSGGIFLSGIYNNLWGVEGEISGTKINYKGTLRDWKQMDYVWGVGYYALKPYYFKLVFHHISTNYNEDFSDNSNTIVIKGGWYRAFFDNLDIELAYSFYRKSLRVFQITPGYYRYLFLSPWEGLWVGGNIKYIHINHPEVVGWNDKNYYSLEITATYWYSNYFYAGISSFVGSRVLSVEKGGYVVRNLGDKYKGGIELSVGYEFIKNIWAKGSVFYTGQKEANTGETVKTYGAVLSLSYQF